MPCLSRVVTDTGFTAWEKTYSHVHNQYDLTNELSKRFRDVTLIAQTQRIWELEGTNYQYKFIDPITDAIEDTQPLRPDSLLNLNIE